ncbi:MAG: acyl-phosphate glycerol 3-phosphate acyltransferase [Nitrospirae bacterium CG_4_9_14_3_um_filter_53_35]|nr:MAG: acyl-phosphate glycerol 3-phosphate acyltransferase [Nitrospirae bacterium CG2_30_53_67]PIS37477.1 MAG: acyl-phosphate glycerol 3-phosphate acyltransferase [Nitrospirae bacterium CG08_land_8_20_14_0_20_52_24]PIV82937.1 MAG: acyl-phosphate glycerol 3-phosphate acyltransferase [Nitrospirae bacterium CG17_big_fil_post_rev_8_21_14_2_50_50_9]PIW85109.1 MAG: acyl-phosphate glycerol 3-phosphate acyltransferase [Nitrospirae bacterium CG_4_8_14_3_um_filter_50_41]PIX86790.1 MAG: acyl-phosphate gl
MTALTPLLSALLSYLLGSVCFGILISRRLGVNLREHGSGNIGCTNVFRVIGKREGWMTLAGDLLKGTVAVWIARAMTDQERWLALSAFFAILGHNFPVYFGFKGGKGVATTFGVLLGYMPGIGFLLLLIWAAAFALTRISSVGALTVSVMLPGLALFMGGSPVKTWFALLVGLMMLVRHKDNIKRLIRGEERPR